MSYMAAARREELSGGRQKRRQKSRIIWRPPEEWRGSETIKRNIGQRKTKVSLHTVKQWTIKTLTLVINLLPTD